jgi:MFS family permease
VSHNVADARPAAGPPVVFATSDVGAGLLVVATAGVFGLAAATLSTYAVISPDLAGELHLSYTQVGVIAAAYLLASGVFQIPASVLGMRFGPAGFCC